MAGERHSSNSQQDVSTDPDGSSFFSFVQCLAALAHVKPSRQLLTGEKINSLYLPALILKGLTSILKTDLCLST